MALSFLKIYFLCTMVLTSMSVFLYVFLPDGTAKFFGGQPTPTTNFWVTIAGGGDSLVAFLGII